MDVFNELLLKKNEEVFNLYQTKMSKNKKMNTSVNDIDYNSKKTINQINAHLDKKLKSSKAYQKKMQQELLNSNTI